MSQLRIESPTSSKAMADRNQLLTRTLRDLPPRWDYSSEYPLVLSNTDPKTSYCLYEDQTLVAHANLWPRRLIHASGQKSLNIGLIGNVSTLPERRGQGHQKQLMAHLANIAEKQGLKGLVLWSDLLEFYQKLGFSSNGREIRFGFARRELKRTTGIAKITVDKLSDHDLVTMLALRPKLEWSLERSVDEFRALLTIPDAHLFARSNAKGVVSWFVVGKGSDMAGVVHEWGAKNAGDLLADIQSVLKAYDLPELTLLAPACLSSTWLLEFKAYSTSATEHPMAIAKSLTESNEATDALARGFIWGLDSI